jgi:hypothetical protein
MQLIRLLGNSTGNTFNETTQGGFGYSKVWNTSLHLDSHDHRCFMHKWHCVCIDGCGAPPYDVINNGIETASASQFEGEGGKEGEEEGGDEDAKNKNSGSRTSRSLTCRRPLPMSPNLLLHRAREVRVAADMEATI